ncbi:hypothetical protein PT2222_100202 [Paraburkholderia tropica]
MWDEPVESGVGLRRERVEHHLGGGAGVERRVGFAADERHADRAVDQDQPLTREPRRHATVRARGGGPFIALFAHESEQARFVLARDAPDRIVRRSDLTRSVQKRAAVEIFRREPFAQYVEHGQQPRTRRASALERAVDEPAHPALVAAFERGGHERVLRIEIGVETLARSARRTHDRIDARGVDAARVDQRLGGFEQALADVGAGGVIGGGVHGVAASG